MSAEVDVWPNGTIELGTVEIEDATIVVMEMQDVENDRVVRLYLRKAAFVALADHMKMTADALVERSLDG